jgi:hypothetical protein
VTLEGTTRKVFDGLIKELNWPMAPQPTERLGSSIPEKTARDIGFSEDRVTASLAGLRSQFSAAR